MAEINDRKANLLGKFRQRPDSPVEADQDAPAESTRPAIELGDLTTGADAEVSRLKSSMIALSSEIGQIRGEHVGLASDYQKLTGELREIKLVLAKVRAKELRAIERRSSWMESLRLVREMFQGGRQPSKNQRARSPRSLLRK